jgi:hypothetical protein
MPPDTTRTPPLPFDSASSLSPSFPLILPNRHLCPDVKNSVLTLTRRYDNIVALSAAADWFTAPSRYGFRGQFDPLGDRVQMLMERLFTNHIAPDGFDYAVQGRGASIA